MLSRPPAARRSSLIATGVIGLLLTIGVLALVDQPGHTAPRVATVALTTTHAASTASTARERPAGTVRKQRHPSHQARTETRASTPAPMPTPSLQRMVGQMLMAGMVGTVPDADLLRRIHDGEIGGVILYSDNIESVAQTQQVIRQLQDAARSGGNPPLLISVDQEGGSVRRFADAPPISPREISSPGEALRQGEATGSFLHAVGVNLNFAPVADVSASQSSFEVAQGRGFNGSSEQVAALATAFAQGLQGQGVAATAKHFPGVGSLTKDTDYGIGQINLNGSELAANLVPFRRLIDSGVDMVMVASAVYPKLDPSEPAGFSSRIIDGLLRQQLGFRGVVITDALDSPSDLPGGTAGGRAILAAKAGADIILYAPEGDGPAGYDAVLAAAQQGEIPSAHITGAYQRILALKQQLSQ